jgi:hypothetical protein
VSPYRTFAFAFTFALHASRMVCLPFHIRICVQGKGPIMLYSSRADGRITPHQTRESTSDLQKSAIHDPNPTCQWFRYGHSSGDLMWHRICILMWAGKGVQIMKASHVLAFGALGFALFFVYELVTTVSALLARIPTIPGV